MEAKPIFFAFLQGILFVMIAPGVVGCLNWFKARLQGRQGPRPDQLYLDLWKLLHRRPVVANSTSWLFQTTPWIAFGCYTLLGFSIPIVLLLSSNSSNTLVVQGYPLWPAADLVFLIYILGLARFAIALTGMDAGSPFGDLGSGREMFFHFLAEPTLILIVFALALSTQTTNLPGILNSFASRITEEGMESFYFDPVLWLSLLALGLVALSESGRIPFDNPSTHLELTMVGKAIHLEYAGPGLALLEWADAMRLTFFLTLLFNLLFPSLMASANYPAVQNAFLMLAYPFKMLLADVILAFWELTRAKLRLRAVTGPATLALGLSVLAVIFAVLIRTFEKG